MAITRLSFPDGAPLPKDPGNFHVVIGELVIANSRDLVFLEQGDYNITPRVGAPNTHEHLLTVLDNGEGLYRIQPLDSLYGYHIDEGDGLDKYREVGRREPINEERPVALVVGAHPNKHGAHLYEIIAHI